MTIGRLPVPRRARTKSIGSIIGAFALLSRSLASAESAGRLVPMDVFQLQLPSDPQISPDGRRIVYVRQFADVQTDRKRHTKYGY